jgi:hypothetical protein
MPKEESDIVGEIFGWIGTVITIFFLLTPIVPLLKLMKGEMKIKDYPGVLLICSFMNCVLWADYGLLHDRFLQYFPNGLGGSITLVFITTYLVYLAEKKIPFALLYNLCSLAVVIGITFLFFQVIEANITGIIANVFNILMYAAPGEKIYTVFKTGNYELIPIWSTIGACACSGAWLIYGLYLPDFLVILPNALGIIAAIIQIIVYMTFKKKAQTKEADGPINAEE